jgi:hypothetical protein
MGDPELSDEQTATAALADEVLRRFVLMVLFARCGGT